MGTPTFLGLSRELRDEIYGHYFRLEDGYWLNSDTSKFTSNEGTRIELDLRSTNLQIAAETRGLALKNNELHVNTCWEPWANKRVGNYAYYLEELHRKRATSLYYLSLQAEALLRPEVFARVKEHYAQFLPDLCSFKDSKYVAGHSRLWKKTPSTVRQFVKSELTYIVKETPSIGWANKLLTHCVPDCEPWCVPTSESVEKMFLFMPDGLPETHREAAAAAFWDGEKRRLSAASMAIRFLSQASQKTRLEIRKVVLHENRKSVAWPESHARGLIQFCKENPNMRIERRVDLWRNAFPAGDLPLVKIPKYRNFRTMPTFTISRSLVGWIMEAVILPSLGMPENAFTLVLTDEPNQIMNAGVFDVAIEDAATQAAFVRAARLPGGRFDTGRCEPGSDMPIVYDAQQWYKICKIPFIMDGFPEAIDAIRRNTSLVTCDFPITTLDESAHVQRFSEYLPINTSEDLEKWSAAWRARHFKTGFVPQSPAPSWLELRNEDLVHPPQGPQSSGLSWSNQAFDRGDARRRELYDALMDERWGKGWRDGVRAGRKRRRESAGT
ncbi:hypothetical protein J4E93_001950 [Alternaria ventricosa]|uniref:uncharacterized protein n=1 Tax=Alternaria ventricosa TaxID=1187951 RepID=UPI0020C42656|nr:uncharacterized protein J4E93_001950 [Alternaria ventricosa]KAI4651754.1 hypothetical protein J4E93_001950 [Alternaria ventricosa]